MGNQYAQHKNRSLSTNKIGNKWKNHNIFNGNRKIMNLKIGFVCIFDYSSNNLYCKELTNLDFASD